MFFVRGRVLSTLFILLSLVTTVWAEKVSAAQITMSWIDNSNNEAGFKLERKTGTTGAYVPLATMATNVTVFSDTTVITGTTYCYHVYAYNSLGNSDYSNEVCNDTKAPTVSITTPTTGTTVKGTTTVTATASDNIGVAGVQFRLDGVDLGREETIIPYSIPWDTTTIPNGSHTLTALARDAAGNQTLSATVPVTVDNQGIAGLAVAYNFDEGAGTTVTDVSGNNRNGVEAGATWTTTGKYSKALSFNGGAAKVTSGLSSHAMVRSYMLWTYRTGPGGGNFGRLFDKRTSSGEVEVLYNDEAARVYRYHRVWSGGEGHWTIPQPSLNAWHHIAVVYDASSTANKPKMYVDGVAQVVTQDSAPSGTLLTNTNSYVLGNRGAADRGWSGMLDDLRVYDTALTGAQIQTVMSTPVEPIPTGPGTQASIAYNFDEGAGTTVTDVSGNNRNGATAGTTWTTTGKFGQALSFNGGAAKVTSGLSSHAMVRSYMLWTYRTGPGGGNFGRLFDKRTSGAEVELLYNDDVANVYHYSRVWSNGEGHWTIPQPSLNAWHHIVVVYDASSAANTPQMYVDGVAQVVTQKSAPSGTPLTNADSYVIGNRGATDRGWSGVLDDLRIYDSALTVEQIQTAMTTALSATTATLSASSETQTTTPKTTTQPHSLSNLDAPPVGTMSTSSASTTKSALPFMLGMFRPATAHWQFDLNGNGVFDGCGVDECLSFGQAGDLPVVGDWLGTGHAAVGSFNQTTGRWQLDLNGNGVFDGCGVDECLSFGQAGDLPVVGDWLGRGYTQVGTFDPLTGLVELDSDSNGTFDGCGVDKCLGPLGQHGDLIVVGKQ